MCNSQSLMELLVMYGKQWVLISYILELSGALQEGSLCETLEFGGRHKTVPRHLSWLLTTLVFQAQLRAFIPEMLKYSTGRGKPGWGKESCKPIWWPEDIPWANVRSDVRTEEQKQRVSVSLSCLLLFHSESTTSFRFLC